MNGTQELHRGAMELAEKAALSRFQGDAAKAAQLTLAAFELERDAALSIAGQVDLEPTRSVLLRSAASLALECHQPHEAKRLILRALAGEPPSEIATELRDLLEQVRSQKRLRPSAASPKSPEPDMPPLTYDGEGGAGPLPPLPDEIRERPDHPYDHDFLDRSSGEEDQDPE